MAEEEQLDWIITEDNKSLTYANGTVQAVGENNGKIVEIVQNPDDPEVVEAEVINPACTVKPIEAYMSSNLNSKIKSYDDLTERILTHFGYPRVSVPDLHRDQIYEAISMACEFYTKYAGFDALYMAIDSQIYEPGRGIPIDKLYTIASLQAIHEREIYPQTIKAGPDQPLYAPDDVYVTRVPIPLSDYGISDKEFEILKTQCKEGDKCLICYLHDYTKRHPGGIEELSVISGIMFKYLVTRRGYDPNDFKKSKDKVVTEGGERLNIYYEDPEIGRTRDKLKYEATYDYDMMDYRKVVNVTDYYEGSSTTMSSLFSFEAALASQTFFTYQFSLRGFDLTSWYGLAEWRKTREKMLATKRDWHFNKDTQYLTLSPPPRHDGSRFFAAFRAYVEKPLRVIIKEPWVFKYALAICKEILGRVRSKWGDSVQLIGGGSLSGNALAQEGVNEKKELEQILIEKRGYSDAPPPRFFVG